MIVQLSRRKQAAVARAIRAQDALVSRFSTEMVSVLKTMIPAALSAYEHGRPLSSVGLEAIEIVARAFLIETVRQAITAARHTHAADLPPGVMRLASYPKAKLPPGQQSLPALFRNRKAWDVMLKRNRKYAEGIQRAYMRKLNQYFKKTIPKLLAGDLTVDEAKAELEQAVQASGPRVETVFRTETTKYFAEAQLAYFDGEPGILGFLFDSVKDSARTDICRSRHGMVLAARSELLGDNQPPLHYNCRSHLIPLADTPGNRKLMEDKARKPENRTLAPLPPGWRAGG